MEKAKSQIYGIFAFWIIIFHLPVIFTSLFVDQGLIYKQTGMLKNEYIRKTFFNFDHWQTWAWEVGFVIIAMTITYFMIWVLPKTIIARAYDRELEDHYNREHKKLNKEKELDKKRNIVAEKQIQTAEKVESAAIKQEKAETFEEQQWKKEYEEFEKSQLSQNFDELIESLYSHSGSIAIYNNDPGQSFELDRDLLAYADSNGLIGYDRENSRITPTNKGHYFIKRYQMSLG
jgi:hypothetical protein